MSLTINLVNNTTSNSVYAFVTGLQIDNGNRWYMLQADGQTIYNPSSPLLPGAPTAQNVAIALGAVGNTRTITIPHTAGGRIYLSINTPLTFFINPGPALVEPSVTNPTDPNININWGFCEFTFNSSQLFANISYVDFVSIPIGIQLRSTSGVIKTVTGLRQNGLQSIASGLQAQNAADGRGWNQLIVNNLSGQLLRILSPNQGRVRNPLLFSGYWEPYVDQVWSRFKSTTMTLDSQAAGVVSGNITQDGLLTLGNEKFTKPSTGDIFSANSGPFATGSDGLRNAIIPRLNAEFNRSTLLKTTTFPAPENLYYQESITNHYARVVHAANADGRGYAMPYDDVTPAGGVDQSGFVNAGDPQLFTINVGGGQFSGGTSSSSPQGVSVNPDGSVSEQPVPSSGGGQTSSGPQGVSVNPDGSVSEQPVPSSGGQTSGGQTSSGPQGVSVNPDGTVSEQPVPASSGGQQSSSGPVGVSVNPDGTVSEQPIGHTAIAQAGSQAHQLILGKGHSVNGVNGQAKQQNGATPQKPAKKTNKLKDVVNKIKGIFK